ncbi:hypothetical protein [Marispirochaeta sp.]|uniref:hypothetical protein n=1 Tax=Marispirochaeta sp. TaxID=2038653 RepID=UPI0029C91627|nr:hypothetical protein [Marispirochaeta sp.]
MEKKAITLILVFLSFSSMCGCISGGWDDSSYYKLLPDNVSIYIVDKDQKHIAVFGNREKTNQSMGSVEIGKLFNISTVFIGSSIDDLYAISIKPVGIVYNDDGSIVFRYKGGASLSKKLIEDLYENQYWSITEIYYMDVIVRDQKVQEIRLMYMKA